MKQTILTLLLAGAMLFTSGCTAQEEKEAQRDLLAEETPVEVSGAMVLTGPKADPEHLPVFSEENDPQATEYLKMQCSPQESEDLDAIIERMWYLGNLVYFAEEGIFAEPFAEYAMENAPNLSRYADFDGITALLYTEKGKEQLMSAEVGGYQYIMEKDGEYYHLGSWRTEPPYHLWMSGYQTVKSGEGQIQAEIQYQEKDLQDEVTGEGSVMMTLVNHDGIWLIDDYCSPTAKYPE